MIRPVVLALALGAGLAHLAHPAFAQIEARQATPADQGLETPPTEVPSPMLLDISLGGGENKKPLGDASVNGRTFYETKNFATDKARITKVTVTKRPGKRGAIALEVQPTITTGYYRQDLDLTVAIVDSAGKEVRKKLWDDLTVGTDDNAANKAGCLVCGASSTKRPEVTFEFKAGEFERLFEGGAAPVLRLLVKVEKGE